MPVHRLAAALLSSAAYGAALVFLVLRLADSDGGRLAAILPDVAAVGMSGVLIALLLTAFSYLTLVLRDHLIVCRGRDPLALPPIVAESLARRLVTHVTGASLADGAALNARLFGHVADADDLNRMARLVRTADWLAVALVVSVGAMVAADDIFGPAKATAGVRIIGVPALAVLAGLALWRHSQPAAPAALLAPGRRQPSPIAILMPLVAVIALSMLHLLFAASVLLTLLPQPMAGHAVAGFYGIFAIGWIARRICRVPAGIVVADAVLVGLLPTLDPEIAAAQVLAVILAWRLLYLACPLALLAAALVPVALARQRRRDPSRAASWRALPPVLAALVFVAGASLAMAGAWPDARSGVAERLPIPVAAALPILCGAGGIALVLLGSGLARRLTSAWRSACLVLAAGLPAAVVTDLRLGFFVLGTLALLGAARTAFPISLPLAALPMPPAAFSGASAVVGAMMVLDAAGAAAIGGATTAALVVLVAVAVGALSRPPLARVRAPAASVGEDAIRRAMLPPAERWRLRGTDGEALPAFGIRNRSWVVPGNPPRGGEMHAADAARFVLAAERCRACPVFFAVDAADLGAHADLGLAWLAVGDQAFVALDGFALTGRRRQDLRATHDRLTQTGIALEILEGGDAPAIAASLAVIDAAWRTARPGRAAVAAIDHLLADPAAVAIARREDKAIAFALLSETAAGLTATAVRELPEAPSGSLDFVLARVMLWAAGRGYPAFDLGLAPGETCARRPLSGAWRLLTPAAFLHAEHFNHPAAVRAFKQRFAPAWRPRYLTFTPCLPPAQMVADVGRLLRP